MVQLMPLPLTIFCFSKIQIGFTFLVTAHLVKQVCACGSSRYTNTQFCQVQALCEVNTRRTNIMLTTGGFSANTSAFSNFNTTSSREEVLREKTYIEAKLRYKPYSSFLEIIYCSNLNLLCNL